MSTQTAKPRDIALHGYCPPKYERLREAFSKNFRDHGEIGGSYAVMSAGRSLPTSGAAARHGGTTAWEQDSIACVWSPRRRSAVVCFAMLVDRGLVSYDDKVSKYWPEFAAEGKADITIEMLLSHQAGITGFDTPATLEDLFAGEGGRAAPGGPGAALAHRHPRQATATRSGILLTALFKRIEGRSIRQFMADELKGSFGIDISVGVDRRTIPAWRRS